MLSVEAVQVNVGVVSVDIDVRATFVGLDGNVLSILKEIKVALLKFPDVSLACTEKVCVPSATVAEDV